MQLESKRRVVVGGVRLAAVLEAALQAAAAASATTPAVTTRTYENTLHNSDGARGDVEVGCGAGVLVLAGLLALLCAVCGYAAGARCLPCDKRKQGSNRGLGGRRGYGVVDEEGQAITQYE